MKELRYILVDVFTNQPFGGNQQAVFPNASGLAPEMMQALAKELNVLFSVSLKKEDLINKILARSADGRSEQRAIQDM